MGIAPSLFNSGSFFNNDQCGLDFTGLLIIV